jgi:5-methylcytosine-specific restriction enzyme A
VEKPKQYSPRPNGKSYVSPEREKTQAMYVTKEWRQYKFRFLHHNPLCYMCESKATVVDHIVAHKGDKILFEKLDNHLPLCVRCHNTLTAKFDRNPKTNPQEKIAYIESHRTNTFPVKVLPTYTSTKK